MFRYVSRVAAAVFLFAAVTAFAESNTPTEPGQACPLPPGFDALKHHLWPLADTSHNGGLSKAEAESIYPEYPEDLFDTYDGNDDGEVTLEEIGQIAFFAPVPYLINFLVLDDNSNGLLEPSEVSDRVGQEGFGKLDVNNNGLIDCGDLNGDPVPPEGETFPDVDSCDYIEFALGWFDAVDANHDDIVSREEISQLAVPAIYPFVDVLAFFDQLDADDSDGVTREEIHAFAESCGKEGEPAFDCTYAEWFVGVFALMDDDGDTSVTSEEFLNFTNMIMSPLNYYPAFEAADADDDDVVTHAELHALANRCNLPTEGEDVPPFDCSFADWLLAEFPNIDTDSSGVLSLEEFSNAMGHIVVSILPIDWSPVFQAIDTDNSAGVDEIELKAWACPVPEGELPPDPCMLIWIYGTDLLVFDANADGKLALDELPAFPVYETDGSVVDPATGNGGMPFPDIAASFTAADHNNDGFLDEAEISALLHNCGVEPVEGDPANWPCPLPDDYFLLVGALFHAFDLDANGQVTTAELEEMAPDTAALILGMLDKDRDGVITLNEALGPPIMEGDDGNIPPIGTVDASLSILSLIDTNHDLLISKEEALAFVSEACFLRLDGNGNGVIDCEDLSQPTPEGEPQPEGEPKVPPCALAPLLLPLFPLLDANNDQGITVDELEAIAFQAGFIIPDLAGLFEEADLDDNQRITQEEVNRYIHHCHGAPGDPGEGELNPEGEVDPPTGLPLVRLERGLGGNGYFNADHTLKVETAIHIRPGDQALSYLALKETIPQGWSLASVEHAGGASVRPQAGDTGELVFEWEVGQVPPLPLRVVYTLVVADANVPQVILGHAEYYIPSGAPQVSPVLATPIGAGAPREDCHSGDYNHDWTFSMSELLRIIQLFNVGGIQCADTTEDGFEPGDTAQHSCPPHTGDINIDWRLQLGEVLRVIQFYNSSNGAYQVSGDAATEDGFAPGMFELK